MESLIQFPETVWRVARVEGSNDEHVDQVAYCRKTPHSDT
jgi:hypothetical protein